LIALAAGAGGLAGGGIEADLLGGLAGGGIEADLLGGLAGGGISAGGGGSEDGGLTEGGGMLPRLGDTLGEGIRPGDGARSEAMKPVRAGSDEISRSSTTSVLQILRKKGPSLPG